MTIINDTQRRPRAFSRAEDASSTRGLRAGPPLRPDHSPLAALRRIEQALTAAVAAGEGPGGPPLLSAAIRHAVFPGGARIRPRLCLAVAQACGDDDPLLADAAAAAIELLHCASLVHDDLPCFDDAPTRRGMPSVHSRFGERIAVLTGDALIVLAFQIVAAAAGARPQRLAPVLAAIARGVGTPAGIVAGQACECEPYVALAAYQRAKTGSLFAACTEVGALAAGADPAPWRAFGLSLGEAYQVADDIRDVAASIEVMGKPPGRDVALHRPSSASELGLGGAIAHFDRLVAQAIDAVPECDGAALLRAIVRSESARLVPEDTVRVVALAA
jgi:geranylgeranyl diphosphate synthase type II